MAKPLHEYDFWKTDISRPDVYDVEADSYLGSHLNELLGIDATRVAIITHLVEHGEAELDKAREYVTIRLGWPFLSGIRSTCKRHTREGRGYRRAYQTMIDELRATGRIRFRLLPPSVTAGFRGDTG